MKPDYILKKLRQRRGLESDDASQDAQIEKMEPMDKVRECAAWELGDEYWADTIIGWARDCGLTD